MVQESFQPQRPEEEEKPMKINEQLFQEILESIKEFPEKTIHGPFDGQLFALQMSMERFQSIHSPGTITFLGSESIENVPFVIVECQDSHTLEEVITK